jgi:Glycosyl transferase family 11
MIFFVGEGRLGNQVFQLRFLRAIRSRGEPIIAIGLESLPDIFELESGLYLIRLGRWGKRLVRRLLMPLLVRPLARTLRLVTYIREAPASQGNGSDGAGSAVVHHGLLSRIAVVDGGYYQSAAHWPAVMPAMDFKIRARRRATADSLRTSIARGRPAAFVHVRRSDYIGYSAYGQTDLNLPVSYYLDGIREIRQRAPAAQVIVVTDDPEWVRGEILPHCPDAEIVSGAEAEDFCLMQCCDAGVVSNSTFSLAAALLMCRPSFVIAPRYWFGFRCRDWLPPGLEFGDPRIKYLDVGSA